MASFALVVHPRRQSAKRGARDLASWLLDEGHEVCLAVADARDAGLEHLARPESEVHCGVDLMVSLGGDGSILHAVELVSEHDIPVLGVNYGILAYLAEVEPTDVRTSIGRWLEGDFSLNERMRLDVRVEQPDVSETVEDVPPASLSNSLGMGALNEVAVEKLDRGRSISLLLRINGKPFTGYTADGLVVSSPTGSTAYSFSLQGPVLSPELESLLVTPVATHSLFDRSLVLPPNAKVRVEVFDERPAVVAIDGRMLGSLHPGGYMECTASPHPAQLITFKERVFHDILKAKFGLGDEG